MFSENRLLLNANKMQKILCTPSWKEPSADDGVNLLGFCIEPKSQLGRSYRKCLWEVSQSFACLLRKLGITPSDLLSVDYITPYFIAI